MPEKRLRQLQPPPESDHFTVAQAVEAWKKVEADKQARAVRQRFAASRASHAAGRPRGGEEIP